VEGGCNMAGRGRKPKTSKEELINLLKKAEVQIVGLDMSDIKKTDIVLIKIAPPIDPRVQAFFEEKTKAGFFGTNAMIVNKDWDFERVDIDGESD